MPILQMSTLRPREVKGCDQGHTASKWWSRDWNSGSLAALPPSCVKTHVLHVLSPCHDTQPIQSVTPLLEREGGSRDWITCVQKYCHRDLTGTQQALPLHSGPSSYPLLMKLLKTDCLTTWLSACGASFRPWELPWNVPEAAHPGAALEDSNAPEPCWAKPRSSFLPVSFSASKSPEAVSQRLDQEALWISA